MKKYKLFTSSAIITTALLTGSVVSLAPSTSLGMGPSNQEVFDALLSRIDDVKLLTQPNALEQAELISLGKIIDNQNLGKVEADNAKVTLRHAVTAYSDNLQKIANSTGKGVDRDEMSIYEWFLNAKDPSLNSTGNIKITEVCKISGCPQTLKNAIKKIPNENKGMTVIHYIKSEGVKNLKKACDFGLKKGTLSKVISENEERLNKLKSDNSRLEKKKNSPFCNDKAAIQGEQGKIAKTIENIEKYLVKQEANIQKLTHDQIKSYDNYQEVLSAWNELNEANSSLTNNVSKRSTAIKRKSDIDKKYNNPSKKFQNSMKSHKLLDKLARKGLKREDVDGVIQDSLIPYLSAIEEYEDEYHYKQALKQFIGQNHVILSQHLGLIEGGEDVPDEAVDDVHAALVSRIKELEYKLTLAKIVDPSKNKESDPAPGPGGGEYSQEQLDEIIEKRLAGMSTTTYHGEYSREYVEALRAQLAQAKKGSDQVRSAQEKEDNKKQVSELQLALLEALPEDIKESNVDILLARVKNLHSKLVEKKLVFSNDELSKEMTKEEQELGFEAITSEEDAAKTMQDIKAFEKEINRLYSEISNLASRNIQKRIADISAVSSGDDDISLIKGIWVSGMYGVSKQGALNENSSGFKGKISGGSIGFDFDVSDDTILGISYSHVNSTVKFKDNALGNEIKSTANIASLYGKKGITDKLALHTVLSLGKNQIIKKRVVEALEKPASSKINSISYNAELIASYDILMKPVTIVPNLGIKYGHYTNGAYEESGIGVNNLEFDKSAHFDLKGIAGINLMTSKKLSDTTKIQPSVNLSVERQLLSKKKHAVQAKFTWMDNYIEAEPNVKGAADTSGNIGFGMLIEHRNIELNSIYNIHLKKKYVGHQGSVQLKINL